MARSPIQTIVIPYRRNAAGKFAYAVFLRADEAMWQFVSGGAENDEAPEAAAKREVFEEAGISPSGPLMRLSSHALIPRQAFPNATHWTEDIQFIPEYAFAVRGCSSAIVLSHEHRQVVWLEYEAAERLLTWESNRVALSELNQRLTKPNK